MKSEVGNLKPGRKKPSEFSIQYSKFSPKYFLRQLKQWWHSRFWHKIVIVLCAIVLFCMTSMYGIARYYIAKHANEPFRLSATFISDYAEYFELDAKDTLHAMLDDLGIRDLRLVSYWDKIERNQGTYDFTELDWQFEMAKQYDAKIALALGLRQPRWPECHMPKWAMGQTREQWQPELMKFIEAVVNRYKDNPQLDSYQLENEFFLKVFGECPDFTRERLVSEFDLVRRLDPHHKLVVSMSNNAIGTPIGEPTPDEWAISVYKRVWDKTLTKRYFEYPLPAWYYAFRAGWVEMTRGHNSFIHELQTEPWPAADQGVKDASIEEQDKSLDADRLEDRIKYGEATGMREVGLWGVEWWYWRKVKMNDPSLWDVGKQAVQRVNEQNKQSGY